MANTSRDNIIAFSESLIPTVKLALMDPLPEVRSSAAKTFDNLHNMIGVKALEEVCLPLLNEIKTNENSNPIVVERALDGLRQVMLVKSRSVLPFLIQYLTLPPVNINALCKLCSCATSEVLSRHLNKILITLVNAVAVHELDGAEQTKATWLAESESLLLSIVEPEGVKTIIGELIAYSQPPSSSQQSNSEQSLKFRYAALDMLMMFCSKTDADFADHIDDLVKNLLYLLSETNEAILLRAWSCLSQVIDSLKGNDLIERLHIIRQTLRMITSTANTITQLPGFCMPKKGINCLLPIFKEGLLNSTPETKELSAIILTECIKLSK